MAGDGHKMNMIVRQAPTQDAQIVPLRMLAQDLGIAMAVFVREEYGLPVVTALRDVLRRVGNDETGLRGIVNLVASRDLREKSSVPFCPFAPFCPFCPGMSQFLFSETAKQY